MSMFWRGFFAFWWLVVMLVGILMFSVSGQHIVDLWSSENSHVWAIAFIWMLAMERFVDILGNIAGKIFFKEPQNG